MTSPRVVPEPIGESGAFLVLIAVLIAGNAAAVIGLSVIFRLERRLRRARRP